MSTSLVTVFGGSGFIGRHTVRALAKAGKRIRVAVRHPAKGFFLPPNGTVGQIAVVKCNALEADQVEAAVHGADAVINLAGVLHSSGENTFEAVHCDAAENIASAAKAAGARTLVHVSAIGADKDSDSAYAATKGEGEARVHEAFPEAAIVRPSLVFGPEDDFFNRFAAMARFAPALPLIGGGHTKFQPVFVGDVAAAIVELVRDPAPGGKVYELGGPNVYSFKELMELMLDAICRKRPLVPLPFALATIPAFVLQFLPKPLLTPDQVTLLKSDNVVTGANTLATLGIVPTSVEAEVPAYLWRFRPKGQYDDFVRDRVQA
ncbi:MAG: complex I NDUFA9 subunit family protein [Alphaproteobacteria bacterium]|nr:complex I NDUFA9 subunit family protein [Alphaproteobacteria bacterium]MBL6939412.1 complex I NDUFA9 subunit family protein [Alphaproteobacteria bacterium]MBL7097107.1 complex I NDUFA9 subunit family protein [Alphaproteobacteria bacterium]